MEQLEKFLESQSPAGRLRYETPRLEVFGAVTELTASGSGPSESNDGSMSSMTCIASNKPNPNCPG